MKVAPLWHALSREGAWCRARIVHTGQHYDDNMSDAFFRDLGLPEPQISLGIGSGTHAEQTGGVMIAYERVCTAARPDWTVVMGDVNSTLACTITAAKLNIRVAHLEAGLRSRDRSMPEELNRLATDALADLLWTPSADADENLRAEGIPAERIVRVGNVMIDSLEMMRSAIDRSRMRESLGLAPRGYAVITLHRPSNVDDPQRLAEMVGLLLKLGQRLPLVFPMHPRTRVRLEAGDLLVALEGGEGIRLLEPVGYVDFMNLVKGSAYALTDSGGIQEETTYLGIPCLTLRENTERPITVSQGTNRLVRLDTVEAAVDSVRAGRWPKGAIPALWDGQAASRAVASLKAAALKL